MLRHVIISDTHAPDIIKEIYTDLKEHVLKEFKADAIVINGDLLGIFSMKESSVHKNKTVTAKEKTRYLKLAAPNWYETYKDANHISKQAVIEYVKERYQWLNKTLKAFSELAPTYWNMGNHESPHHFLVVEELPFLLDKTTPVIPDFELKKIFSQHEQALAMLELTHKFTYLRNKVAIQQDTLILAIPGESHLAEGNSSLARKQEAHTTTLIQEATTKLPKVKNLLIYNHTQGSYNKKKSLFTPASKRAKEFLTQLPTHLKHCAWIQSHNHWSYTQHLQENNQHYILNNAGLHKAIYNLLEIDEELIVYDRDTQTQKTTKLRSSNQEVAEKQTLEIIKRTYPNYMDIYLHRKMISHSNQPIRK